MGKKPLELTGFKFGRLTVLEREFYETMSKDELINLIIG